VVKSFYKKSEKVLDKIKGRWYYNAIRGKGNIPSEIQAKEDTPKYQ
jgi:hypothetical protein